MAIKNIVKIWNNGEISEKNTKFLKLKTKEVTFPVSNFIKNIIQDLIDTYKAISCAGIAANQIGYDYQIFIGIKTIVDEDESKEIEKIESSSSIIATENPYKDNYEIYINPKIDKMNNKSIKIDEEGCLSIPGLLVERERYNKIKVRYYDLNGKKNKMKLSGFLSKLFQHELDHLNGELMIDDLLKIDNLYPLDASEENAKLCETLYTKYRKLIK